MENKNSGNEWIRRYVLEPQCDRWMIEQKAKIEEDRLRFRKIIALIKSRNSNSGGVK